MRTGTFVKRKRVDRYHDLSRTVLRDGNYVVSTGEMTRPLYQATSTDGGASWSQPRPVPGAAGACLRLLVLDNGVLALSFGRYTLWGALSMVILIVVLWLFVRQYTQLLVAGASVLLLVASAGALPAFHRRGQTNTGINLLLASILVLMVGLTFVVPELLPAIGIEGIFRDVTEKRRVDKYLAQTEKLASIGQLASGVAHEINNPLGVIKCYAGLIAKS